MKVFVIQPNLSSDSETWLFRINQMLGENICGFAAFLEKESFYNNLPVFNLNGRNPNFMDRILIRLKLLKYNAQNTMRRELYNAIRSSGAEMILVQYATTAHSLWDVISRFSIPVYIYVHGFDIIWDHNDDTGKSIHPGNYRTDISKIGKSSNITFIVSSNCSLQNLLKIDIDRDKIKKKVFGVEIPLIERDYNKKEINILFLGRFVDYKGPQIVLEAFLKACEQGYKGNLIMAGDGPLKLSCEVAAQKSDYSQRVSFTGAVTAKEALALFEAVDIYSMHNCKGAVSNGYDTFGVTIIEALSYGLPVVTSIVGGPSEIIENEVDGILVQPNNVEEHAAAFVRLYNDRNLCAMLGSNGRNKIIKHYSSQKEKEALFEILHIN